MASLLKASGQRKRKAEAAQDVEEGVAASEPPKKRNKQKVLLLSSRGVTSRMRHLMSDLEALLPHVKKGNAMLLSRTLFLISFLLLESKLDSKNHLSLLPELADLHNCNNALYFEARRHEDLYMWASKTPNGPSIKLHVQNIHTMDELKMTGNCLKGSRGILSFDKGFDETEWGKLTKELFTHVRRDCLQPALKVVLTASHPDIRCPTWCSTIETVHRSCAVILVT
jgi:ribosome biogenesis protein BRX1